MLGGCLHVLVHLSVESVYGVSFEIKWKEDSTAAPL